MTFRPLKYVDVPKIEEVVSQITGRQEALRRTHGDGRVDVKVMPGRVILRPDDIERWVPLNDLRRMIYDQARSQGMGHEQVVTRIFRDGKVIA